MVRVLIAIPLICAASVALAQGPADKSKQQLEAGKAKLEQGVDAMVELAAKPLREFKLEKPQSCQSDNLRNASVFASHLVADAPKMAWLEYAHKIKFGAALLDVADAARDAKCVDRARRLYDLAIEVFVGAGFAGIRQRAEIGINDLRAKN